MSIRKFRWSKDYESAEEELLNIFKARNIEAKRVVEDPELDLSQQLSNLPVRLWCAEGSFYVITPEQTISMQPGDAIDITIGTQYQIHTGLTGCIYYKVSN